MCLQMSHSLRIPCSLCHQLIHNYYHLQYYPFLFLMLLRFQNKSVPHRLIIGMVLLMSVIATKLLMFLFHLILKTQLQHQSLLLQRSHLTLPLTNPLQFAKVTGPLAIHILFIIL
jgi:hypothetical protein